MKLLFNYEPFINTMVLMFPWLLHVYRQLFCPLIQPNLKLLVAHWRVSECALLFGVNDHGMSEPRPTPPLRARRRRLQPRPPSPLPSTTQRRDTALENQVLGCNVA